MKSKTKDAYVEVLGILNLLEDEHKNKIPKRLKEFFENNNKTSRIPLFLSFDM